jgi:nucleoside-diphosphate-sugar epimerase
MKRVLVTGGTGFVGSNLVRRLLRDGCDVHLIVRPGYTSWRLGEIAAQVTLHEAELTDSARTAAVLQAVRAEWIFHLAVYGAYPSQQSWRQMIATNVLGTTNLVESALAVGFEAFVNTGSSSEYGAKRHAAAETDGPDPNSEYGVSKVAATLFCRRAARHHSVSIPTLRLYSAYGPFEEPSRLIPTLVINALEGGWPPLVEQTIARDFVHVSDVCEAYILAASTPNSDPGSIYNVGTGSQTTIGELVDLTREIFGVVAPPLWGSMAPRLWDTDIWVADVRKIQRELGWRPTVELRCGLKELAKWLRANPGIWDHYRSAGVVPQARAHVAICDHDNR